MRMAQYRACGERFDLQPPPLESMFAVQSALTQLSEALAADMIERKRADRLIRVLNCALRKVECAFGLVETPREGWSTPSGVHFGPEFYDSRFSA